MEGLLEWGSTDATPSGSRQSMVPRLDLTGLNRGDKTGTEFAINASICPQVSTAPTCRLTFSRFVTHGAAALTSPDAAVISTTMAATPRGCSTERRGLRCSA